jgi:hypothetical protein
VITSGDCYNWHSADPRVIRVKGTHHGLLPSDPAGKSSSCFSNGIVELVHEGEYPASMIITAEDQESYDVISIPVRIRNLTRVSIFTKSRIMNIK